MPKLKIEPEDVGSPPIDLLARADDEPTRRRPGRPRVSDEDLASLSVWLPQSAYDRLQRFAQARHQSLSSYVREVLLIVTSTRR